MSSDAVQYAVLGLISAREAGIHGYRLKNDFDALYGDFWALTYGHMYRTLGRLEREGLIEGTDESHTGRPNRRVFRITALGRTRLDAWLVHLPDVEPRLPRDELSIRLLFLNEARANGMLGLIGGQRALCLEDLARLGRRRDRLRNNPAESFIVELLLIQADLRARSQLAWLDIVEAEVRQRFGGSGTNASQGPDGLQRPLEAPRPSAVDTEIR